MIIILFIVGIFLISFLTKNVNVHKKPCNELKKHHKWASKGEKGSEYMVCLTCKIMPGGEREESV